MTALQSIRPAASGIVRNPVLVVITALFGLSQLPNLLVQPTRPVLAAVVSLVSTGVLILVVPFFQGGLLGMASEAIRGKTSLSTLIAEGKANYVPLLLAYVVLLAVNVVFAFVVVFAVVIAVIGVSIGGVGGSGIDGSGIAGGVDVASGVASGGGVTLLAVIGVVAGGLALAYLLVTFFVQFYSHAIVLDDTSLVDGFRRSVGLVRSNLLGVFGYSLVLLVGGVAFGTIGAIGGIVSAARGSASPELPASPLADLVAGVEPTLGILVAFAAVYVLSTGVFGAFYATYSVAFYESIRPDSVPEAAAEGAETTADTTERTADAN